MEPPSSTSSRKRKQKFSTEPGDGGKRSKCDEEAPQQGRSSGSPRISVQFSHLQQPISLKELTELLHYAALGRPAGVQQPSWCRLIHQRRITAVNVVVVDGLTQSLFYKHYMSLTHLRSSYSTRVTFTPSPSGLASGIFSSQVHASSLQKHSRDLPLALRTHPVITRFGTQTRGLTAYVLSQEEMIRRHFPVRGLPGFEDFVCTDVDDITDSSPLFGLDCEMCLTENGYELTRVSLVDSDGICILDQLVKPQTPIIDYLTRFSGVTAAMLQPIRTSLRDVQVKLRTLLPSNAVLVGHSLNNDLMVLKLIHRHVIDSSLLFRGEFGRRFKLKVLAETVLRRRIQTKDEEGHDPSEDAVAALQLVQYFIRTGPRQVVERHLEDLWGCELEDSDGPPVASPRFADILQALGQSVGFIGRRGDMSSDLSNQLWFSSDRQVVSSFRGQDKCPFLSVLQLSSFSTQQSRTVPHQEEQKEVSSVFRDMCLLFAGPFPAGVTEAEVRRIFSCCGRVHSVQMLRSSRLHAQVEFELLEASALALDALDGLVVQGQTIKVQRPVHQSVLDLDLTLDALSTDRLNTHVLYAVKSKSSETHSGHLLVNGVTPRPRTRLSEDTVRQTFARFGPVDRVVLAARPGRRARYAHIYFQSPDHRLTALSCSEDLRRENYLIHPALTPPHLPSWVTMTTPSGDSGTGHMTGGFQEQEETRQMRKLDQRLQKLFRCLPDGTLSVVILSGQSSARSPSPGLCFLEVKQAQR